MPSQPTEPRIKPWNLARNAADRGIRVIIAGAGGAAHLPGVVAALTPLPVIGVPIKASISIDGWDSILSILQMPPGIPVATVGLDGAQKCRDPCRPNPWYRRSSHYGKNETFQGKSGNQNCKSQRSIERSHL